MKQAGAVGRAGWYRHAICSGTFCALPCTRPFVALAAPQLRDGIVSNSSGTPRTILAPQRGIWGTAGIDGKNLDQ